MTQYPDWFSQYAIRFFAHHLTPLAGRPGLRFVQIGAFTGDATMWMLDHILTGTDSKLFDVDTWEGSDEPAHEAFDWPDVWHTYYERVSDIGFDRLLRFVGSSLEWFQLDHDGELYDFVYVDGDHAAAGVLSDAIHAYEILKVGGLIAFDDYLWKSGKGRLHDPAPAIDAFADLYSDRLERLDTPPGEDPQQVWFRKTR